MEKKYTLLQVVKVGYMMGHQRRKSNYVVCGIGGLLAAGMAFFAFAFMFTTLDTFAWLLYGTMILIIVGEIFAIIWRIREAVEYIKTEQQEGPRAHGMRNEVEASEEKEDLLKEKRRG